MKSYLLAMGFDNILDKDHFPDKEMNAKWGVHDHVLFEKVFEDYILENSEKMQVALSLSSHPPYDIPETNTWHEKDEETQFINSAHYTDKHFGILLDKMSQTPNWKNTLVIVLADHGCRFPGNVPYHVPEKFKIPILWTGGVIQIVSVSNAVTSQQDICASLLSQLDIPYVEFTFSQNIFSIHYKPFAYYAFNNGITWIDEDGSFIYSLDKLNWISYNPKNKQKEDVLKIYFQAVFDNIQME
jgi:phosphoglycerol transferase MdoB-like AlkP superfamily enzyme